MRNAASQARLQGSDLLEPPRRLAMQPETEFQLTPEQAKSLVLRTIGAALPCTFAFGWGQYGVAPGGQYTFYGIEAQSFDPATYRWFFQDSFGFWSMAMMGTITGVFYSLIAVPIGLLVLFALMRSARLAPLAHTWVNLDKRWSLLLACGSWLAGLALTIHNGLNPGICC